MKIESLLFTRHEFRAHNEDEQDLKRLYHDLYCGEFPNRDERESYENIWGYLQKKSAGWYGANNYHVLSLRAGKTPVAVAICDYLEAANAGIIEFLAVDPRWRGKKVGKAILTWTEEVLRQDAVRVGKPLCLILAEMEDPFKVVLVPDQMNPFERARIWERWGFQKLDFEYVQPALDPKKKPVRHLWLMMKRMDDYAGELPSGTLKQALHGFMRFAMRIEHPEENDEYRVMAADLDQRSAIDSVAWTQYEQTQKAAASAKPSRP